MDFHSGIFIYQFFILILALVLVFFVIKLLTLLIQYLKLKIRQIKKENPDL